MARKDAKRPMTELDPIALDALASDAPFRPPSGPTTTNALAATAPAPPPANVEPALWQRWWLWTAVGAVVVGGGVGTYLLVTRERTPSCPTGGVCK